MDCTPYLTYVTGELITATILNTDVRDNLLETGPALVTTKGDIVVAAAANNLDRVAVGANERQLVADSAETTGVRWTPRHLWFKGADIASAATITPGTDGNLFHITGITTITAIATLQAGSIIVLVFDGALTLTHNATTLILLNAANLVTVAGDVVVLISEGAGNWRELSRRLAAGGSTIRFDRSAAITAAQYEVGRDADVTNQLHFNVPTGASFEFSINDAEVLKLSLTATVFNDLGADTDFRAESDANANFFVLDAGLFTGQGGVGFWTAPSAGRPFLISPVLGSLDAIVLSLEGSWTVGGGGNSLFSITTAVTGLAGTSTNVLQLAPAITVPGGVAITNLFALNIAPTFVAGTAPTLAATVRILGAPGLAAAANDYSLWVDAGLVRWDDPIALGAGVAPTLGTIGGSGPATAGQNQWLRVNINGTTMFIPVWA